MVVIHVKRTEVDQFLFECGTGDSNDRVIRELAEIWNQRERIARLAAACEELAKHGRMKPEAERGLDDVAEREGKAIDKGPYYAADPLGIRDGNAPPPTVAETIRKVCVDALASGDKHAVAAGVPLTAARLRDQVDLIRGAVTMAYPMGLPAWDPVAALLHDAKDEVLAEMMGSEYMDPATATLWWAGKEFFREGVVGDRVGKNEKTKIVAKLQRQGGGAPAREPAVSEEERKAMMAYYFKKQEEAKALAEDGEDAHLSSAWADPRALKSELLGMTSVTWRPMGGGAGRR